MISTLLKRLTQAAPDPLPEDDARLALAALLVRAARSDGDYAAVELERIERILKSKYGLDQVAASQLRAEAEELEAQAPDTVRFTRTIKEAVPFEERLSVIEALWEVVLTDGARDDHENTMLRLVTSLLGVNDRDSNMARKRIEARMG